MAVTTHRASIEYVDGLQLNATARNHRITIDEPKMAGGKDEGMTPVEALLTSLGACKMIVAKSFARGKGMKINHLSIDVEGELDSDGYLERNRDAKVGFINLKTTFNISADNTDEEIEDFIHFVETHCPVHATIAEAPEFETEIKKI